MPLVEARRSRGYFTLMMTSVLAVHAIGGLITVVRSHNPVQQAIVVGVTLALSPFICWWLVARGRLFVTHTEFGRRLSWRKTLWVPRSRIARLTLAESVGNSGGDNPQLVLVYDTDGRLLARLDSNEWRAGGLMEVVRALQVPVATISQPITVKQLAEIEPRAFRWFEKLV